MRLLFAIARAATLAAFFLPPMPLFLPLPPLLCLHSHPLTLCFYFRFLFLYIFLYTVFNFYFVHFYYMPFSLSLLPSHSLLPPAIRSCARAAVEVFAGFRLMQSLPSNLHMCRWHLSYLKRPHLVGVVFRYMQYIV